LPCISNLARNNVVENMVWMLFEVLVLIVFKIFFI
jgi:hypothetical protein